MGRLRSYPYRASVGWLDWLEVAYYLKVIVLAGRLY